jgi:hypothetical protein
MSPTSNQNDTSNLSTSIIKYNNILFSNGYIIGFITGVVTTVVGYSIFHKCHKIPMLYGSKIIRL